MLYVLMGQDEFSLGEALEELKRGIGDQSVLAVNTTVLDAQQVTLARLSTVCETVPFLGERRLVIINGLMGRFETKNRSGGRKKATPATNQEDAYKAIAAYLTQLPDSATVVLVDGEIGRNNPLLRELSGKVEIRLFPRLRDSQLRQWIERRIKAEGGTASSQAVNLLSRLVGSNLWVMASEINKLVLFTAGRRIEEDDVKMTAGYAQEASVFAMVDAILEFRAGIAEGLLQRLLREGAAPPHLLVVLSRQVQRIVRVRELSRQGQSKAQIQQRLGLISEYALRKVLEQAGRYPLVRLKGVYQKLLEADLSIKTGKYDGELALNILVAELCQLGRTLQVTGSS